MDWLRKMSPAVKVGLWQEAQRRSKYIQALQDDSKDGVQLRPLPGPQTMAFESDAMEVLYGGKAGGGKSMLLLLLSKLQQRSSIIMRRTFPELEDSVIIESLKLFRDLGKYNMARHVWNFDDGRRLRFGHAETENDVLKYKSAQFDFIGIDELTEFTKYQFEYMTSRARTTIPGQRVRVVAGTNPGSEGNDWVIDKWGPWLDVNHSNPAKIGEVRWFIKDETGKRELETTKDNPLAVSRTFIPADRVDMIDAEYIRRLNLLGEPFRSQLLDGVWERSSTSEYNQLIPSEWITSAIARWKEKKKFGEVSAIGVDVARGGTNNTVLAKRAGNAITELIKVPGKKTKSGDDVVALVVLAKAGNNAVVSFDAIAVGSAVQDASKRFGIEMHPVVWSGSSKALSMDGLFSFVNIRAEHYWRLREALDPDRGTGFMLPDDQELVDDLRTIKFRVVHGRRVLIESKDEIIRRLKRSIDCGDAVAMTFNEPELNVVEYDDYAAELGFN